MNRRYGLPSLKYRHPHFGVYPNSLCMWNAWSLCQIILLKLHLPFQSLHAAYSTFITFGFLQTNSRASFLRPDSRESFLILNLMWELPFNPFLTFLTWDKSHFQWPKLDHLEVLNKNYIWEQCTNVDQHELWSVSIFGANKSWCTWRYQKVKLLHNKNVKTIFVVEKTFSCVQDIS